MSNPNTSSLVFHWPQEQTIIVAHGPGEERTEPVKDLKKKKGYFLKKNLCQVTI